MVDALRVVIVTDLDGTLLDTGDYSWVGARAMLARLERQRIPVVICSSKTRAEIERCRQDVGLEHPFISENGGGLFIPDRYFRFEVPASRRVPGFTATDYGWRYDRVVSALREAADETGVAVAGFNDLSLPKVARLCGLSLREAQLAVLREYDEPFTVLDDPPDTSARYRLYRALSRRGLQCTRGGRFDHAHGSPGKGAAVSALRGLYERQAAGPVLMIGLGDARNDLSLLRAVDVPIVVPGPSTSATLRLMRRVPGARLAAGGGSGGWASAVRDGLQAARHDAAGRRAPTGAPRRAPAVPGPDPTQVIPGWSPRRQAASRGATGAPR